jgi:hypothetical protein
LGALDDSRRIDKIESNLRRVQRELDALTKGGVFHIRKKRTIIEHLLSLGGVEVNEFSTDDTLAGNSDDAIPTEQAVKAYVDGRAPAPGCAFLAYNSTTDSNVTGDGTEVTVDFDTERFDLGGDFASDTLTAPANGYYMLGTVVTCLGLAAAHTTIQLDIETNNKTYRLQLGGGEIMSSGNRATVSMVTLADMAAAHTATVKLTVSGGTKVVGVFGGSNLLTYFWGYRVA